MSSLPSPRQLRRALIPSGVLVLGALAALLFGFSDTVEVVIDGETRDVRTYASTVAEVLDSLDIEVGPADEVSPSLATAVRQDLRIDIARAITVDIEVDAGVARRVTAPADSVADVLLIAGMEDVQDRGAEVRPALGSSIADGDVVRIDFPVAVAVAVDGEEHELDTFADEVGEVLAEAGVEVGPDDQVLPGEASRLLGPTLIVVQRVRTEEIVEEVVLPHDDVRRQTKELRKGRTSVEREGRDGLRRDTYRVTFVDGEESERELTSREIVEEPVSEIVRVGTAEPARSSASGTSVWDRLAACESNGRWDANTGNGYYGGLQFHPATWRSVGGTGLPHQHSRATQIEMGKRLQARSGWGQWPACSRKLGLR